MKKNIFHIKIVNSTKNNYNPYIYTQFIHDNYIKVGQEPAITLACRPGLTHSLPKMLIDLFAGLYYIDELFYHGTAMKNTGYHFRLHGIDTRKHKLQLIVDENYVTKDNLVFMSFGTIGSPQEVYNYSTYEPTDLNLLKKYLNNSWINVIKLLWFSLSDAILNFIYLGKFMMSETIITHIIKEATGSHDFLKQQIKLQKHPELVSNSTKTYEKICYIFASTTAENYRGQGIGEKYHQHLVELAKQHNCDAVYAEATGLGSFKIFERLGFRPTGSCDYQQLIDSGKVIDCQRNRSVAEYHRQSTRFFLDLKYSE